MEVSRSYFEGQQSGESEFFLFSGCFFRHPISALGGWDPRSQATTVSLYLPSNWASRWVRFVEVCEAQLNVPRLLNENFLLHQLIKFGKGEFRDIKLLRYGWKYSEQPLTNSLMSPGRKQPIQPERCSARESPVRAWLLTWGVVDQMSLSAHTHSYELFHICTRKFHINRCIMGSISRLLWNH